MGNGFSVKGSDIVTRTIFFSWQSDLDNSRHRNFLERCINQALKNLSKADDAQIYMNYDRDTLGLDGSPDITSAIFDKIEKSVLFICDISIVTGGNGLRKSPNPNVLIELGFAIKQLGWDKVICLFDKNTGSLEDIPFDLRQKRILQYDPNMLNEKQRVVGILGENIKSLFVAGKLFNPLKDYMKGRIDKNILDICKQISNILFGTVSMSEGLSHVKDFLSMNLTIITDRIQNAEFPGFIVLNNYNQTSMELREILKEILSSAYFSREWTYTVLNVIDWIRRYEYLISKRNPQYPLEINDGKICDKYAAILGESLNPANPKNSYIVLEIIKKDGQKYIEPDNGRVINITQYPIDRTNGPDPFKQVFSFNKKFAGNVSKLMYDFNCICNQWLDITDSEFVFDPDYYLIHA